MEILDTRTCSNDSTVSESVESSSIIISIVYNNVSNVVIKSSSSTFTGTHLLVWKSDLDEVTMFWGHQQSNGIVDVILEFI